MTTVLYNLAKFDLVSIRLAVYCAQTGSLTAAARDSHLALAAASRRIRELESALGDTLFKRHARGLVATAAGRVFVKHDPWAQRRILIATAQNDNDAGVLSLRVFLLEPSHNAKAPGRKQQ